MAEREDTAQTMDRLLPRARFLHLPLARFILFRWFAASAVLIAPVVLRFGLGLQINLVATSIIAGGLAAINLTYVVLLRRMEATGWSSGVRWMEPLQALVDLIILTVLLFITGGVRNPLLMFYVFHVIVTGILFKRIICFSIAVCAILFVVAECAAEVLLPGASPDIFGLGSIVAPGHFSYLLCILAAFSMMLLVTALLTCDIAERLRREEKRLAAATEHLTKLEEAKSRLLYFVAHEMKSPLVAITSCLQAARSLLEKQENVPDAVTDMLRRARARSDQMAALVAELLELSRQRSMPNAAPRHCAALISLVQYILDDHREAAEKKHIALGVGECDTEIDVLADCESLQRALGNLVGNAIEYTPESGKVEVSVLSDGDMAKIVVADSGIGIPEEDLDAVFQEFYRSANARKVSRIGTGLGLAIVKTIVENHGGRIAVESKIGEGSTFTVWLPKVKAAQQ
ncbi:MAG: HAMP domain-containing histidine kinase [Planctomycetes bacterium]|nr:HAMP domain-containing histidine kinase [Planctomycetota bacterium]